MSCNPVFRDKIPVNAEKFASLIENIGFCKTKLHSLDPCVAITQSCIAASWPGIH